MPFTVAAYLAASIPSAVLAALLVARWLAPAGDPVRHLAVPAQRTEARPDLGSVAPWLALVAVVVAVELASYFHGGSRSLYPTISSAVEDVFRHRAVKAAAFLGWMAGGWYLVTR